MVIYSATSQPVTLSGLDLENSTDARKMTAAAAYGQIPLEIQEKSPPPPLPSGSIPTAPSISATAPSWTFSLMIGKEPSSVMQLTRIDGALRLLAQLVSPLSGVSLKGRSPTEESQVDAWLSYFWSSVDLPLQALTLMRMNSSSANGGSNSASGMKQELTSALTLIDKHLLHRTYLVGDALSVADISLAISMDAAIRANVWSREQSSLTQFWSYFDTLAREPWFTGSRTTSTTAPASSTD